MGKMRAGGFIPPEMNIESTNNFTTTIQRHNEQRTIAIPILLSVTQRNVLLRPSGCLITHYSLRRGRRAGDIVGRAVNGYNLWLHPAIPSLPPSSPQTVTVTIHAETTG